jgi:hypothetical protein
MSSILGNIEAIFHLKSPVHLHRYAPNSTWETLIADGDLPLTMLQMSFLRLAVLSSAMCRCVVYRLNRNRNTLLLCKILYSEAHGLEVQIDSAQLDGRQKIFT